MSNANLIGSLFSSQYTKSQGSFAGHHLPPAARLTHSDASKWPEVTLLATLDGMARRHEDGEGRVETDRSRKLGQVGGGTSWNIFNVDQHLEKNSIWRRISRDDWGFIFCLAMGLDYFWVGFCGSSLFKKGAWTREDCEVRGVPVEKGSSVPGGHPADSPLFRWWVLSQWEL